MILPCSRPSGVSEGHAVLGAHHRPRSSSPQQTRLSPATAFPRRLPLGPSPAREYLGIPKALLPSPQPHALVLPPGFIEEHRAQDPTQNPYSRHVNVCMSPAHTPCAACGPTELCMYPDTKSQTHLEHQKVFAIFS